MLMKNHHHKQKNNNQNKIKETEETKPRYKYLRGYVKHFEKKVHMLLLFPVLKVRI